MFSGLSYLTSNFGDDRPDKTKRREEFINSVAKGNKNEVQKQLNIKYTNPSDGLTTAIQLIDLDMVNFILKNGGNPNTLNTNGVRPLIYAIHIATRTIEPYKKNPNNKTLRDKNDSNKIILALLNAGASIEESNSEMGYSQKDGSLIWDSTNQKPIIWALRKFEEDLDPTVMDYILEKDPDAINRIITNDATYGSYTPLTFILEYPIRGKTEEQQHTVVKYLLDKGANPNIKINGKSPVTIVNKMSNDQVKQLVLDVANKRPTSNFQPKVKNKNEFYIAYSIPDFIDGLNLIYTNIDFTPKKKSFLTKAFINNSKEMLIGYGKTFFDPNDDDDDDYQDADYIRTALKRMSNQRLSYITDETFDQYKNFALKEFGSGDFLTSRGGGRKRRRKTNKKRKTNKRRKTGKRRRR